MKPEKFTDFEECGDYKLGWNDCDEAYNTYFKSDDFKEMIFESLENITTRKNMEWCLEHNTSLPMDEAIVQAISDSLVGGGYGK